MLSKPVEGDMLYFRIDRPRRDSDLHKRSQDKRGTHLGQIP